MLIVFNLVVTPILMEHQVKETDYGTFMSMIEKKNIGEVEVNDNQIIFTSKRGANPTGSWASTALRRYP